MKKPSREDAAGTSCRSRRPFKALPSLRLCGAFAVLLTFTARAGVLLPDLPDPDQQPVDLRRLDPTSAVSRALAEIAQPRPLAQRIDDARARVERRPEDPAALHRLGQLLLAANRLDEAIEYFWRAARLRPNDEDRVEAFGFALLASGDHLNGIKIYEAIWRRNRSSPRALFNLAAAYHNTGRTADAIPLMRDFTSAQPTHARGWYNLGVMHLERGQIPQAGTALQRAIELQPNQPFIIAALGRLQLAAGRTDRYESAHRHLADLIGPERAAALLTQHPIPVFLIR